MNARPAIRTLTATIVGALAAVTMTAGPAAATVETTSPRATYVLAAWEIANPASIWETPQTLITSVLLDTPTLDALDGQIPCGVYAQVDLYIANPDSAALILGGVLYGPNNPTEPLAHGAVAGDPWKFHQAAPCAEKPEPRPWSTSTETVTCEGVTVRTAEGYFDLDFDPIANVWTERPEPTVVAEASSTRAATTEELAAACPPNEQLPTLEEEKPRLLAETGVEDDEWVFVGLAGLALTVLGLIATIAAAIVSRRRDQGGR